VMFWGAFFMGFGGGGKQVYFSTFLSPEAAAGHGFEGCPGTPNIVSKMQVVNSTNSRVR
jgi:hypothetical protein